jgi:hypothetical protein
MDLPRRSAGYPRDGLQKGLDLSLYVAGGDIYPLEQARDEAVGLREEGHQQMLGLYLLVVVLRSHALGIVQGLLRLLGKAIYVHRFYLSFLYPSIFR